MYPTFAPKKNTCIGNELYSDGRSVYDVITVAMDADLHSLFHFSYTLVIELFRRVAQIAFDFIFQLVVGLEIRLEMRRNLDALYDTRN